MSQALDLSRVRPGFPDPVRQSQAVFRQVMDAVARPGTPADLSPCPTPPAGLAAAAGAVALTLFDFETPVWLDPALGAEAGDWLRFHCGCPLVTDPAQAAFAIVVDAPHAPPLAAFHQGDAKYPDRSTTVLLQVAALDGGEPVTLRGPGIRNEAKLAPTGLPGDFWDQVQTNHMQFQFGVDLLLVAGSELIGLPRSTRVEIEGA